MRAVIYDTTCSPAKTGTANAASPHPRGILDETASSDSSLLPWRKHLRRQHLQQLGSLGLLATGDFGSLHALTAQAQDSQRPLHVLLIGNANYQRNAVLRNPARDVQLLAQAFGARCAGCNGRLTTCRHG